MPRKKSNAPKVKYRKKPPSEKILAKIPKDKLEAMLNADKTLEEICAFFVSSGDTINVVADAYGLVPPWVERRKSNALTPEAEKKLRDSLKDAKSYNDLARMCGKNIDVVRGWLRALKLEPDFQSAKDARKARDQEIIRRVCAGESNSKIAGEMGLTLGQVSGVRARAVAEGLAPPGSVTAGMRSAISRRSLKKGGHKERANPYIHPKEPKPRSTVPVPPTFIKAERVFESTITFENLKNGKCKFPVGPRPYLFCGRPTENDGSWCPECLAVVFEPQEVKKRKDRSISVGKLSRL